jgi:ribosomal protein S18 acetylase RimI-like enzyme
MSPANQKRILEQIRECEILLPRTYALWQQTDWGILYYAPYNPTSYDSNHALITDPYADLDRVVQEVIAFYGSLGLTPRIYPVLRDGECERLAAALTARGFQLTDAEPLVVMLHDAETYEAPANVGLEMRRVTEVDQALVRLIHSEETKEYTEGVLRRQVQAEQVHVLVGFVGDDAVTMATLNETCALAQVDNVETAPAHRRKGYNLALMRYLVRYHREISSKPLYLFSDNPIAVRNYQRVGFLSLDVTWAYVSAYFPGAHA